MNCLDCIIFVIIFMETNINTSKTCIFLCLIEPIEGDLCKDKKEGCVAVTPDMCKRFSLLKKDCPYSCQECECQDTADCSDITSTICETFSYIKYSCQAKCGVCHPGKYFFL